MNDPQATLAQRMRDLAARGHERAAELVEKAQALEEGVAGYYGDPQTITVQSFLGRYARARLLWRDCTGEALV